METLKIVRRIWKRAFRDLIYVLQKLNPSEVPSQVLIICRMVNIRSIKAQARNYSPQFQGALCQLLFPNAPTET